MGKRPLRIYVDTSVFGGVFDKEFAEPSRRFFHLARLGVFDLVTSVPVQNEMTMAPPKVREFFDRIRTRIETIPVLDEGVILQAAYVEAGIVGPKWLVDALHVALATVSGCPILVSWNFKHIVNFRKVGQYNAVNALKGHPALSIVSPPEVIGYYEENEEKI